MSDTLTGLERELLGYVERLVTASEASAKGLQALEQQWTQVTNERLDGLTNCVSALTASQRELATSLEQFFNDASDYADVSKALKESLRLAKIAEARLTKN